MPGRTGPPRAPSRWRSTLCIQSEGLTAQTRALPVRSARRGDIRRCTIRPMGGRACGPTRKQSRRMPTGPASAQSRRPACLGNAIGGPSQRSTSAASPYVRWASLGNIRGSPRSARFPWPVLGILIAFRRSMPGMGLPGEAEDFHSSAPLGSVSGPDATGLCRTVLIWTDTVPCNVLTQHHVHSRCHVGRTCMPIRRIRDS